MWRNRYQCSRTKCRWIGPGGFRTKELAQDHADTALASGLPTTIHLGVFFDTSFTGEERYVA